MTINFMIKCNKLNESSIILTCNQTWSQEDIPLMLTQLCAQHPEFQVVEQMDGADRVVIRLIWQQGYFLLNFECYSESIWLEAEDLGSQLQLASLYQFMV